MPARDLANSSDSGVNGTSNIILRIALKRGRSTAARGAPVACDWL